RPVSLMTGAGTAGAGWLVWARAGTPMASASATPTPTPPPLFVISSTRWRMYRLWCRTACGRRNVAPGRNGAQGPPRLLGARQELVFQTDDLDERVEIGKLHPAPAYAARHRPALHRRAHRGRQAVGSRELALLALGQHEGARDAGLHGMQVPELATAHLVHPHPLPRRPHEHDLFGDVLEGADPGARAREPLGRTRRQILERRIALGPLARALVERARPVPGGLLRDGDHAVVL